MDDVPSDKPRFGFLTRWLWPSSSTSHSNSEKASIFTRFAARFLPEKSQDFLKQETDKFVVEAKEAARNLGEEVKKELNDPETKRAMKTATTDMAREVTTNLCKGVVGGVQATIQGKDAQEAFKAVAQEANKNIDTILNNLHKHFGKAILYATCGLAAGMTLFIVKKCLEKYIEKRVFEPRLATEKPGRGFFDRVKPIFGFNTYRGPVYRDLILQPQEISKLNEYFNMLKNAKKLENKLPSLILSGPPGTGKTEAIKRIAEELGFNFVSLLASTLDGYSEQQSIQHISELFNRAENSYGKTIIFIDKAERIFQTDDKSQQSEKSPNLVAHFISQRKALNSKYTLIYELNKPVIPDGTMNMHVTYQIGISLPQNKERRKISEYYFQENIVDGKNNIKNTIEDPEQMLSAMETRTEGLSGAAIEEIFIRARNLATMKGFILTQEMLDKATDDVLEKSG